MTDRHIIFSASMIRALLEGRKTQTRRVVKRLRGHREISCFGASETAGYDWHFRDPQLLWHDLRHAELLTRLHYAIGDRLWVREAWAKAGDADDDIHACPDMRVPAYYRADAVCPEQSRWRPSIHMPRWASRLTLTVTDVRVQRVQDISEEDAIAEGTREPTLTDTLGGACWSERDAFARLWNSIHGPDAWHANPWVCALTFAVHRCNIDEMGGAA